MPARPNPSMLISTVIFALALGVVLWVAASAITGSSLNIWEVCVVLAAVVAVLGWWRRRLARLRREQIDSLRDSALW